MNNEDTLTKDDLMNLASVYVASILSFQIVYEVTYFYYEKYSKKYENPESICLIEYKRWTPQKKADFVSRITSQIHAFIAIFVAAKALFYTCVDSSTSDVHYASFFSSDFCLMQHFDLFQMQTLCITAGYLTFDIYICYARIQEKSKLQTQTYIHHIIVLSGFISSIFYGRGGALIISNVLLINEFSTFFLNYRHFLLVFKRHESFLYRLNSILFFLAFFFSRIVFNTVVSYFVGRAYYLTTKDSGLFGVPFWQLVIGLYLIALFVIFYILNLVWFMGILKHVKRQFFGSSSGESNQRHQEQPSSSGPSSDLQEGLTDSNKGGYSSTKESYEGMPRKRDSVSNAESASAGSGRAGPADINQEQ